MSEIPVRTTSEWIAYFVDNAQHPREIPWDQGLAITPAELAEIATSLCAWQLGETSDGSHLRGIARKYAETVGDADFPALMDLFIAEEQGHGALLGRFLDLAGVPRANSDWGDSLFRFFRHCLANMETFTTPVIMAEIHALVYYNAIRQASNCPVLRKVCEQLLSDEIPHIRLQCERLAILHRDRPGWLRSVTMLLHRVFFTGVTLAIWAGHRRALKAGGYGFGRFWKSAWSKMNWGWRMMDPKAYPWEAAPDSGEVSTCTSRSVIRCST